MIHLIKAQILRWLGHVKRMPEEGDVKKIYKWKVIVSRPVGCPKIRWMDTVMKVIQTMKTVKRKPIVEQAKVFIFLC
jgi:hypothetical protein